ncbi:MAG: PadR family transcriptional regulator [Patescibacteria group bacterium]
MNSSKIYQDTQLKKGFLDLFVLLTLQNEQKYASEIIKTLAKVQIDIPEGTLYPLLNRLKKEDLLSYNWEESSSGPPRKYYLITESGKSYLDLGMTSLNTIYNSIQQLAKNK